MVVICKAIGKRVWRGGAIGRVLDNAVEVFGSISGRTAGTQRP